METTNQRLTYHSTTEGGTLWIPGLLPFSQYPSTTLQEQNCGERGEKGKENISVALIVAVLYS